MRARHASTSATGESAPLRIASRASTAEESAGSTLGMNAPHDGDELGDDLVHGAPAGIYRQMRPAVVGLARLVKRHDFVVGSALQHRSLSLPVSACDQLLQIAA